MYRRLTRSAVLFTSCALGAFVFVACERDAEDHMQDAADSAGDAAQSVGEAFEEGAQDLRDEFDQ